MADDVNRLFIEGRLTKEPEMKSTGSGVLFAKFSLASSEFLNEKYHTSYFECVAFGELGEEIIRKLKKGNQVFITGKIQHYQWKDRMGVAHSRWNILVKQCTEITGVLEAVSKAMEGHELQESEEPEYAVP